jgi:ABC-type Fe3+-hydroxamate transport system substrate-binding protein
LPAVKAGKAYGVDVPWNEGSIIAAHMLLDTLEDHLAQEGAAK